MTVTIFIFSAQRSETFPCWVTLRARSAVNYVVRPNLKEERLSRNDDLTGVWTAVGCFSCVVNRVLFDDVRPPDQGL